MRLDLQPRNILFAIVSPVRYKRQREPDRWAEERQYLRNDATMALDAFRRRRSEVLALLRNLSPDQWERGSIHPVHGRINFVDWTAGLAAHDDNHMDQLRRSLPEA